MREPYTQLYVHLVWATWDRLPLLTPERREAVYACIQAQASALKADVLAIGGVENHVHVLVRYLPTTDLSNLIKQMKGASSHLVTHEITPGEFFKWQGAYGAFSFDKRGLPVLRAYVLNQEEHHRAATTDPEWEFE